MDDREWRLNLPEEYEPSRSITHAYACVGYYRNRYAKGLSDIDRIVVEFDEGEGWQEYDVITFKRTS